MKYEEFCEFRSKYYDSVREALIQVARERRTVGYKELLEMPVVGLPKEQLKPQMWIRYLNWMLDEFNVQEVKAGKPLLSAVVVSKNSGLPGNGFFFNLTARPGLVPAEATEEEKRAVHEEILQCVYAACAE